MTTPLTQPAMAILLGGPYDKHTHMIFDWPAEKEIRLPQPGVRTGAPLTILYQLNPTGAEGWSYSYEYAGWE